MIGPSKQKMPDRLTCDGCDVLKSIELGGTLLYPKKFTAYYCSHPDFTCQVAFIARDKPWTPSWCPVMEA